MNFTTPFSTFIPAARTHGINEMMQLSVQHSNWLECAFGEQNPATGTYRVKAVHAYARREVDEISFAKFEELDIYPDPVEVRPR